MSLKAELTTWASAIAAYDEQDYETSIAEFEKIADTSKIQWNIGIILATLGKHAEALDRFYLATQADIYFTVAYHQAGVSNFMLGRYEAALKDFEDALLYLRGNQTINYEQLGLDFRLYSAEVLFNCGLAKIYLGQVESGLADLREASGQKLIAEHGVIDDAIRDQGRDYNVFSVPVGVLFKPSQKKLQNLATRDYMGKAILVAATDVNDAYTTFTGITRLQRGQTPSGAPLSDSHPISRSASISVIPQAGGTTPMAGRMTRSNTVAVTANVRQPLSPAGSGGGATARAGGLTRSTTTARPNVRISTDLPTTERPAAQQTYSASAVPSSNSLSSRYVDNQPRSALGLSPMPAPRRPLSDSGRDSPGNDPLLKTPLDRQKSVAVTEIYDQYYNSSNAFEDDMPTDLPPIGGAKRAAAAGTGGGKIESWVNKTPYGATPSVTPSLIRKDSNATVTGRLPPSAFARGGGAPLGRSGSIAISSSNRESNYQDGASEVGSFYDMAKIRVKVNYGTVKRGMSLLPTDTYESFVQSIRDKLPELSGTGLAGMNVRFKDEDGDMLSMQDEGDFEAAVDVARVLARGRGEGKLEIWVG